MKNKPIFIRLPKEYDTTSYRTFIEKKLANVGLDLNYSLITKDSIKINLKEDIQPNVKYDFGYNWDLEKKFFIQDKPTLLFQLNKDLKTFCICPAKLILEEHILGIGQENALNSPRANAEELNLFEENYLTENIEHPIIESQIVGPNNVPDVLLKINKLMPTKINLHGNLDYIVPFLCLSRHSEVNILGQNNAVKHRLKTRRYQDRYFLEVTIREPESNLIKNLFYLALRSIFLEINYTVPLEKESLNIIKLSKQIDNVKYLAEIYYDLIYHGAKYSKYLYEDLTNDPLTKNSLKHQKKVTEICMMLKKVEGSFFGFEMLNCYIFKSLESLPPVSYSDLALLQKETFDEASLVIQAFFDLLISLEKKLSNKRVQNEY